jgi:hypothetical protein
MKYIAGLRGNEERQRYGYEYGDGGLISSVT